MLVANNFASVCPARPSGFCIHTSSTGATYAGERNGTLARCFGSLELFANVFLDAR